MDRVSSSPALTPVTVDATIVRLRINMDLRDQRLSLLKVHLGPSRGPRLKDYKFYFKCLI